MKKHDKENATLQNAQANSKPVTLKRKVTPVVEQPRTTTEQVATLAPACQSEANDYICNQITDKTMTDLLEALRYTDEVISGEKSPIEGVEVTYEEAGENCTFYIVTTHVAPDADMSYDCDGVAVILWEDGTIVTQRDWQTPTSLTKLEDVSDTRATDWMSPQGEIVMLPTDGLNMPSVFYGL